MKIAYFFEDFAHEEFIRGFVRRLARENEIQIQLEDILATKSGNYRTKLVNFLRKWKKGQAEAYDVIIMVHDANCKGTNSIRKRYQKYFDRYNYSLPVVFAIPDPYIEYWYLLDSDAFIKAIEGDKYPKKLPYQCQKKTKRFYKTELAKAIMMNGIEPIRGGSEYGEKIAENIDYKKVSEEKSIGFFIGSLEDAKNQFKMRMGI